MSHILRDPIKKLKSLSGAFAHYFSYGLAAGALLFTIIAPTAMAGASSGTGVDTKTIVGTIRVPGEGSPLDTSNLEGLAEGISDNASNIAAKVACTPKTSWVKTGSGLTGTLYYIYPSDTLYVDWVSDGGAVYASAECAKNIGYVDSSFDTSSFCTPYYSPGDESRWDTSWNNDWDKKSAIGNYGYVSAVPYFKAGNILNGELPCTRYSAVVAYKISGYYYNNLGVKVDIACKVHSWKVTVQPSLNPNGAPTPDMFSVVDGGEETCAAWDEPASSTETINKIQDFNYKN